MHNIVFNIISLSITACLYSADTPLSPHHNVSHAIPIRQQNKYQNNHTVSATSSTSASSSYSSPSPDFSFLQTLPEHTPERTPHIFSEHPDYQSRIHASQSPQRKAIQVERKKRKKMLKKLYQSAGYISTATQNTRTIQRAQSQHKIHPPSSPQADKTSQKTLSTPNSSELKRNSHSEQMMSKRSKSSHSKSSKNLHQAQNTPSYTQQQTPPRASLRRSHSLDDIRSKVPNLAARFLEYFKLVTPKALEYQAMRNPQGFSVETEHDTYVFRMHVTIEKKSNK